MDYEFVFESPRMLNQESLDLALAVLLGVVYKGSTVWWSDVSNQTANRIVITVSRQLTQEELNVIAGI